MTKQLTETNKHLKSKSNTKIAAAVFTALSISAIAMPAAAGNDRHRSNNNSQGDYARVINVEPIVERYQVNNPVEHCWTERVAYNDNRYDRNRSHRRSSRNNSHTPQVVGAIIGGVIGNQIGKRGGGNARDVATVAGAVLGGSIGNDVRNQRKYDRGYQNNRYATRYENVEQCVLKDSYVTKERIVAYDVAYKYKGEVFHSTVDQHPGDKIKVNVSVRPAY